MKDNIESKYIGNRKFILELRFDHKVVMLDKKGTLVEKIKDAKIFSINHWEIGQSDVTIRDDQEKENAKNIINMTLNRLNYISFQIDTVESFYDKFIKIITAVKDVLGDLNISRIGCRIIGTYFTTSTDSNILLKNFKDAFPGKFMLEKYPVKDFLFNLVYENGMYQIGPLSKDDNFYDREFSINSCNKHVGIAIDTDNYITNEIQSINELSRIKDVFMLALSVEKDLFNNLMGF